MLHSLFCSLSVSVPHHWLVAGVSGEEPELWFACRELQCHIKYVRGPLQSIYTMHSTPEIRGRSATVPAATSERSGVVCRAAPRPQQLASATASPLSKQTCDRVSVCASFCSRSVSYSGGPCMHAFMPQTEQWGRCSVRQDMFSEGKRREGQGRQQAQRGAAQGSLAF